MTVLFSCKYNSLSQERFRTYGSLVLKATVLELVIAYWYSLTEFSFHFFTSSDFVDKFALKGIDIRIKLTRKPSVLERKTVTINILWSTISKMDMIGICIECLS